MADYITTIVSGFDDPGVGRDMTDFKASVVAYEVQKSFANKFFSNKTVAKSLIDDTSARLLDNLYLLLKVFVSSLFLLQMKQSKKRGNNWNSTIYQ